MVQAMEFTVQNDDRNNFYSIKLPSRTNTYWDITKSKLTREKNLSPHRPLFLLTKPKNGTNRGLNDDDLTNSNYIKTYSRTNT